MGVRVGLDTDLPYSNLRVGLQASETCSDVAWGSRHLAWLHPLARFPVIDAKIEHGECAAFAQARAVPQRGGRMRSERRTAWSEQTAPPRGPPDCPHLSLPLLHAPHLPPINACGPTRESTDERHTYTFAKQADPCPAVVVAAAQP
jgi:hypothetical protein